MIVEVRFFLKKNLIPKSMTQCVVRVVDIISHPLIKSSVTTDSSIE